MLAEAAFRLIRVRAALWVRPFAALHGRMDGLFPSGGAHPATPARVGWAVAAAARRLPGTTCLVEGLAAVALLRRRGYRPVLHVGVRRPGGGQGERLDAHAWVECDGRVVAGKLENLVEYRVLAPARPADARGPA